ncbi:GerAB/ArcD/ProY family transporter [Alkaliphilus peptidifermentans]|uniref:Spore germination protein (Amino acid permease) n=1 Tax=Alkaliphilus peptidifermentans DSM 18978 TaxID=1120976 RepID=A0A1G5IMK2_9FIRM|nr:endospore germination permease [Alkaliphilus peptidifermentans]SCY76981.1 spore germination protein (amino acid permease) [Alkaliphilus peptidifermentans DSM 18978]
MHNKYKISGYQLILLIILTNLSTTVLYIPGGETTSLVRQTAWLSFILATCITALLCYLPLADLGSKYPNMSFIGYSQLIMGKYIGKFFSILFLYYVFILHSWGLLELGNFFHIFLPETPLAFNLILFSLLVAYCVRKGLEVIGRCSEFVFPIGLLALLVIMFANYPNYNIQNLLPINESSLNHHILAIIPAMSWLTIGYFFAGVTSSVNNPAKLKKNTILAIGLSGLILLAFSFIALMVFGPKPLADLSYPLLTMSRTVVFEGLGRLDIIIIVFWITWIFIRVAFTSYVLLVNITELFGLSNYRYLIIPEAIIAISYAMFHYDNYLEQVYYYNVGHLFYNAIPIGIPLIVWVVHFIKSRYEGVK